MYLSKKILMMSASVLLVVALTACGGSSGSNNVSASAPSNAQTIKWQLDGNGSVQFLTNDPQYYGYTFWDSYTQANELQMTTVTATVEKLSGSLNSGHGIVFCYQDTNNFYRLLIDAGGHYSVYAKVGGTYITVIPWITTNSAILNSGFGVSNIISVTQQSLHNFSVSFNGKEETQFSDNNFTGGTSGFSTSVSPVSGENFPVTPEDVRFKLSSPVVYPNIIASATLAPGQSIVLTSGETIMVPAGTMVSLNGSTVTVTGDNNTINTSAGAVVSAPISATGSADNTVRAI
jgi:hypothetical protein